MSICFLCKFTPIKYIATYIYLVRAFLYIQIFCVSRDRSSCGSGSVIQTSFMRDHMQHSSCRIFEISVKSVTAEYCNARPSASIAECARFDVERVRRERKKENKKRMVMRTSNTDFCALLLCMVIYMRSYILAGVYLWLVSMGFTYNSCIPNLLFIQKK